MVWIMVPAGEPTQQTVDGWRSCWTATTRSWTAATPSGPTTSAARGELKKHGIHYMDVGTSGGVWGLEVGYCMMVGGPAAAVKRLAPILDVLAPADQRDERGGDRAARLACTSAPPARGTS